MSPLEFVSGLMLRHLKGTQVQVLRDGYFSLRTRMEPALKLIHGTFDSADIDQSGSDLKSTVTQASTIGSVDSDQTGTFNTSVINQTGGANQVVLSQSNDNNRSGIVQGGGVNEATADSLAPA